MKKFKSVFGLMLILALLIPTMVGASVNGPAEKFKWTSDSEHPKAWNGFYLIPFGVGKLGAPYDSVVRTLINRQLNPMKIKLLPVPGGTAHTLNLMKEGELAMGAVQGNGPSQPEYANMELESLLKAHKEYLHFMTRKDGGKSNINEFSDLGDGDTVAVGNLNGGTALTWRDIIGQIPKLKKVGTSIKTGTRARKALGNNKIDGMFAVTGLRAPTFMAASRLKDSFQLRELDFGGIGKIKFDGERVYYKERIDDDVYPGLISGRSIQSYYMYCQVIATAEWIENNEALYEKIVRAMEAALPNILKATKND